MQVEAQPGACSVWMSLSLSETRLARVVLPVGWLAWQEEVEGKRVLPLLFHLSQVFRRPLSDIA